MRSKYLKLLFVFLLGALVAGFYFVQYNESSNNHISLDRENQNKTNDFTILVNKKNRLKPEYVPAGLVYPNVDRKNTTTRMVSQAALALEKLFLDAKKEGHILRASSGYRSYAHQQELYNKSLRTKGEDHTKKYVALPGCSEHQTGLTMDVIGVPPNRLSEDFGETPAGKWLASHAHEYGFIIRYPKGKEHITGYNYEPWHIRYVGQKVALSIYSSGQTLEEYLDSTH